MNADAIRRAYAEFVDAAQTGHYQPPVQGGWTAELVLAHVIVGDRLIAEAAAKMLTGAPVTFDNLASQSEAYLRAVVAAAGDWDGLVASVKRGGEELAGLMEQLSPEQLATPIPCRIISDHAVVIDATFPLLNLVRVPADTHLRMHIQQLAALSGGAGSHQVASVSSA
jgi:hypothetical protein